MRLPVHPWPGDRPFDAVGLGLNSVDLIVRVAAFPAPNTKQPLQELQHCPGGQAATAMVACARQGWRARYIGRFGDDAHGTLGRVSLIEEGVDIGASSTVAGAANQFAVIIVDDRSGERTIMWHRDPRLSMRAEDVPAAAVQSGRVLLVDCHETEAAARAAALAHAAGMPTVLDVEKVRPGLDHLLCETDVIIAAEDFPSRLTGYEPLGRALREMARVFPAAVICATLGSQGSLALANGHEIRTPAFPVSAVDTTGAGDVFRGGFIAAWLRAGADAEVEDLLLAAAATAALKCRAIGARTAIPTRAEVDALLRTKA